MSVRLIASLSPARWNAGLRTVLLAVTVFGCCAPARALDPQRTLTQAILRKWQVPQGLPQATVHRIIQTADGYLWLGTQAGLFRFDGIRFVPVPVPGASNGAIESLWVQDLCEDRERNLWIATDDEGLIRYRDGISTRIGLAEGLPSLNVRTLLLDHQGDLWIGTDHGLARYADGRITLPFDTSGLGITEVRALALGERGSIWFGGVGSSLGRWDGTEASSWPLTALPRGESVVALLGDGQGTLWVGTSGGLIMRERDRETLMTVTDGLADSAVECLSLARDGTVWVGTRDGISRLRGKQIESFRARNGLSHSMVHTVCEDHEGGIWVGTKHGLNQFLDRRTIPLTTSEGLPGNDTGPILQDEAGVIWIGTLGQGLARSEGQSRFQTISRRDGLPSDTILSLADGVAGRLWVGTDQGLARMRGDRIEKTYTKADGLPSDIIDCVILDREGTLWVGTDSGLALIGADQTVRLPRGEGPSGLAIRALIDGGRDGVLAATESSLFKCRDGAAIPREGGFRSPLPIQALCLDSHGMFWVGTRGGGVALVQGETSRFFTIKEGLFDNDVSGIVADDEDRLWMACTRGVFFVRRSELLQCATGELSRFTSYPFSPMDAQRTIECQNDVQPVVWRMKDRRLWFSTTRGVTIIDPANIQRVVPPFSIPIEEVRVNGEDVRPRDTLLLSAGQSNISFRYTALSFFWTTRMEFGYRLDGFDKNWIDAGTRREAFYTNLPPGNYTFRVRAKVPDGSWQETGSAIAITIPPHFYQTRWFALGSLVVIGVGVWGVHRLRLLRVRTHLNAVLAERTRIARELHDTLIQGFSGVTMQMQALSVRLGDSPEKANLNEIIQDAGTCLREARRSVGGLREASANGTGLVAALTQAARQLTETGEIRLRLELPEKSVTLPADVEYHLLRIAQEAILNAVRHSGAGTIDVAMQTSSRLVCLTVKDDGHGFAPADIELNRPGHYGLIGMRERASQIHAELKLESELGQGTTVRLQLPISGGSARAEPAIAEGDR